MNRRKFLEYTKAAMYLPVVIDGMGAKAMVSDSPFFQSLLQAATVTDRVLVIIQLSGGNDGLNMVIPLDQMSVYTSLRSNIALKEAKILRLNGSTSVGLHPAMTGLQRIYNEGKLSIVQGASYPNPNFSHFEASDIWMTAVDSGQTSSSGWAARYLVNRYPNYPTGYPNTSMPDPVAIQIGSTVSTSLVNGGTPVALVLQNPDTFAQLVGTATTSSAGSVANNAAGKHLTFIRQLQADSVAYATQIKNAAAKATNLVTYPTSNSLADQLKIVARLVAGGLQTKIYQVNLGGFDTHAAQTYGSDTSLGTHATLLQRLSDAITAFLDDLKALNVADKVVGMTFSEFGRRALSNASGGTDHGAAAPMFVFGAGIQTQLIGGTPNLSDLNNGNLKMQNDFRQVYAAILEDWFGATNSPTLLYKTFTPSNIFRTTTTALKKARQGIENPTDATIQLYPNPVSDFLIVESTALKDGLRMLALHDMNGQEQHIKVSQISTYQLEVDVTQVHSGRYLLTLGAGEEMFTEKVIVFR